MFRTIDKNTNSVRYITRSVAKVVDNRDPLKRGRIRVFHNLLGKTVWIPYLRLSIAFEPPKVNDLVYIECDVGYPEYPVAWGIITSGKDAEPNIPEEFKRTVPTNRGFFSPGGHLVELDDGEATPTGDPAVNTPSNVKKGIRITTSGGHKIHLSEDDNDLKILIEDKNGNKIDMDSNSGTLVVNVSGSIELNGNTGNVLTTETSPIIDTVYGGLHIGSTKVKAGP